MPWPFRLMRPKSKKARPSTGPEEGSLTADPPYPMYRSQILRPKEEEMASVGIGFRYTELIWKFKSTTNEYLR